MEEQIGRGTVIFLQPTFTGIKLGERVQINWNPKICYLSLEGNSGVFASKNVLISLKDFPISISSSLSKAIDFGALFGKSFDYNIGLNHRLGYHNSKEWISLFTQKKK